MNRISDIMVSVLVWSVVDRGFEPGWVKPKTKKLVFIASPLSTQHKGERADWLARNQDNVSDGDDMSIRRLLFQ
jgi:hypothetical protein